MSTDSYIPHSPILQTSIKFQKGHTKVNFKRVQDFEIGEHPCKNTARTGEIST